MNTNNEPRIQHLRDWGIDGPKGNAANAGINRPALCGADVSWGTSATNEHREWCWICWELAKDIAYTRSFLEKEGKE